MTDRQRMFDYLDGVADGLNESRNDVTDVLDKIRDEIEQFVSVSISDVEVIPKNDVLQIIDKYTSESEEKE